MTEPTSTQPSLNWKPSWGPAPRWATPRSPERPTFGPQIARSAELLGTPLFAFQRFIVTVASELDPATGEPAYDEVVVFGPRRIGKTFLQTPVTAFKCGYSRCEAWLTAQKRESAVRRWATVEAKLSSSVLRPQLHVRRGKSDESIRWVKTGSLFLPFAPSDDAMHGEDPDLVWVDELWSFGLEDKSSIEQGYKPAWSVKPGQAWLLSAAGTEASAWMNLVIQRGRQSVREGRRRRTAYFEFGVPEVVDGIPVEELPDEQLLEVVYQYHPRRDHGLRREFLVDELADMGRVDFLRAYGNVTAAGGVSTVIETAVWKRVFSQVRIPPFGKVALGVAVDEDQRETAVLALWRDPTTGVGYAEVLRCEAGTRWVASYVKGVVTRQEPGAVAMRINSGADRDVADQLKALDVEVMGLPSTQVAAACERVEAELTAPRPTLTHPGAKVLTEAMRASGRRRSGGGRVWAPRGEQPITAWDAYTLAVWGFDHMPAAPARFKIR